MATRLALSAILVLTFSAGLGPLPTVEATHLAAQAAATPHQHEGLATPGEPGHGSSQCEATMQHMMKMHEQMMADMKAADARLDALVKDMNAATGTAKVDAMAAVLNELFQQRHAMQERMGRMHEHMAAGHKMHR
jgi:3-hydroxyisobutyrate dehydrogenase-like beta-hydroxyacid dehydrogenase